MKDKQVRNTRRGFIAAMAAVPAVAAAVVLARRTRPLPMAAVPSEPDTHAGSGYHETEHTRAYYRSAGLL